VTPFLGVFGAVAGFFGNAFVSAHSVVKEAKQPQENTVCGQTAKMEAATPA
jgi:hypothetical protein